MLGLVLLDSVNQSENEITSVVTKEEAVDAEYDTVETAG